MATCYWTLCNCPDAQPCPEHSGFNCGLWNGSLIQDLGQINDRTTRDAELALAAMDDDTRELDRIEQSLRDRKSEIERERADLESLLDNASGIGERRDAARRVRWS